MHSCAHPPEVRSPENRWIWPLKPNILPNIGNPSIWEDFASCRLLFMVFMRWRCWKFVSLDSFIMSVRQSNSERLRELVGALSSARCLQQAREPTQAEQPEAGAIVQQEVFLAHGQPGFHQQHPMRSPEHRARSAFSYYIYIIVIAFSYVFLLQLFLFLFWC